MEQFSPVFLGAVVVGMVLLLVVVRAVLRPGRDDAPQKAAEPTKEGAAPAEKKTATASVPDGADDAADGVGTLRSGVVPRGSSDDLPNLAFEEELDLEATRLGDNASTTPASLPVVYDHEAETDEPTSAAALFLTAGYAQTDAGMKRKRNEDSLLVSEDHHLYVVADGMGGHRGGARASQLAVEAIRHAFDELQTGDAAPRSSRSAPLPRRASELVDAIQQANSAVLAEASADPLLKGMGTTVSAARFSPQKERLYIGHVGDSRVYRCRDGRLEQMTSDHTMQSLGFEDANSSLLSRAVGVNSALAVDVIIAKPQAGDSYLLCSDGLTKMVPPELIAEVLKTETDPNVAVAKLVQATNERGGHDNVTVIVVRVTTPGAGLRVA